MKDISPQALYKLWPAAVFLTAILFGVPVWLYFIPQVYPQIDITLNSEVSSQNKSDYLNNDIRLTNSIDIAYPVQVINKPVKSPSLSIWLHPLLAITILCLAISTLYIGGINRYLVINLAAAIFLALYIILMVFAVDRLYSNNASISATLGYWLFYLSDLCLRLYLFCSLYILWHQPYKIGEHTLFKYIPWAALFALLVPWFTQVTGIYSNYLINFLASALICSLFSIMSIYWQCKTAFANDKNGMHLVNQITMRWLAVTMMICIFFGFGLHILYVVGVVNSIGHPLYRVSIAMLLMIGITVLLLRSQLYKLNSWWWRSWGFLGAITIGFTGYIFSVLGHDHFTNTSVLITFILAYITYLIISINYRNHFARKEANVMQHVIPQLVEVVGSFSNPKLAHYKWGNVLEQTFTPKIIMYPSNDAPLAFKNYPTDENMTVCHNQPACICDNGASMLVLGFNGEKVLLKGAAQGMRLFNNYDEKRVLLLWRIASQGQAAQIAYLEGESSERSQIAADLQDDIGRKLMTMISVGGDHSYYVKDTLQTLTMLTKGLYTQVLSIADLLADINYYVAQSCEFKLINYSTHIDIIDIEDIVPSSQAATFFSALLNELLRNALQHEQTTQITLHIQSLAGEIHLCVTNDGLTTDPDKWCLGLGISSIKRRIHDIAGDIEWVGLADGGVVCKVRFDTDHWFAL